MVEEQRRASRDILQAEVHLRFVERWDSDQTKYLRRELAAFSRPSDLTYLENIFHLPGFSVKDEYVRTGPHSDTVLDFFEDLGFQVKRHFVDIEMSWNTFGYQCIHWWAATERYVEKLREERSDPTIYREFENLSKVMTAHEQKRRNLDIYQPPGEEELQRFLLEERTA